MSQGNPKEIFEGSGKAAAFSEAMIAVVREHRLRYFLVTHFPEPDKAGLIENVVITNWPQELLGMYENVDMFRQSRVVAGLKKSIVPVFAETLLYARAKEHGIKAGLLGIYCDDGFSSTIGLSLHDASRRHYLMMLSGDREIVSDDEVGSLILNSMRALDGYSSADQVDFGLSQRELDCLRWSAAGKSSEDIAIILHLSPHTINGYLKSAMQKLNTVSRIQAVAVAARHRLI